MKTTAVFKDLKGKILVCNKETGDIILLSAEGRDTGYLRGAIIHSTFSDHVGVLGTWSIEDLLPFNGTVTLES